MATLQSQGVPVPDRLGDNGNVQRTPKKGRVQTSFRSPRPIRSQRSNPGTQFRGYQEYGPTRIADKSTSGVGLLEAEFFAIIFLLIMQLFVGTDSYGDKIMSFMKRGTLTTVLFFFLALIAGIGPNAAKVSKGLGALVFVATLISSPGQNALTSLDNFFKADWKGTSESGNDTSADSGTSSTTTGTIGNAETAAGNAANTITEINIPGIGPVFAVQKIIDALKGILHL